MTTDEAFTTIRAHCMSKEGAVEDYPWEDHVGWKVGGKLFGIGGAGSNRLTLKSTMDKQAALIQHPNIEKAAYVGRFGWVTISVTDRETMELAEDLIDESYDLIAKKRRRSTGEME